MLTLRKKYNSPALVTIVELLALCAVVVTSTSDCVDSLNKIYEAEQNVTDDSTLRRYILCPGQTYNVATQYNEDGTPIDGDYPIPVGRSNIHVLCGEDGKSENECILARGIAHVGVVDEFNVGKPVNNTVIQGITFQRASSINILATIPGELEINDCIFKNNKNVASIFASVQDQARRLSLASSNFAQEVLEEQAKRQKKSLRNLQGEATLNVKISNCLFAKNTVGYAAGATTTSVVYSEGASVEIADSAFVETQNGADEGEPRHFGLIIISGADLLITNSCFLENDPYVAPIAVTDGSVDASANFLQRTSSILPDSSCEFIGLVEAGVTSCQQADSIHGPSSSASWTNQLPCMTNLNDIYNSEEVVSDDSLTRTYILCPDTEFRVATSIGEDGTPYGGSYPMILARSNIRILCGVDGRSENNCNITSGTVQMALYDEFQEGVPVVGALVQGLTFQMASSINVLAAFFGDVILQDCIFLQNENFSPIVIQPAQGSRRLRSSSPKKGVRSGSRKTQVVADTFLSVVGCKFRDNVIGSKGSVTGLINNQNGIVELVGNIFDGTVNVAEQDAAGFLVGNFHGFIQMIDNCFFENQISIAPVMNQNGTIQAYNNSGTSSDIIVTTNTSVNSCEFIAEIDYGTKLGETPIGEVNTTCVDFDLDMCMLPGTVTSLPPTENVTSLQPTIITLEPSPEESTVSPGARTGNVAEVSSEESEPIISSAIEANSSSGSSALVVNAALVCVIFNFLVPVLGF